MVTQTSGDDESTFNDDIMVDMTFDLDVTEVMDIDLVQDADVDTRGEYLADADFSNYPDSEEQPYDQIMGDIDTTVDEVMDIDGVQADVDTGVNVVTTATSLTP